MIFSLNDDLLMKFSCGQEKFHTTQPKMISIQCQPWSSLFLVLLLTERSSCLTTQQYLPQQCFLSCSPFFAKLFFLRKGLVRGLLFAKREAHHHNQASDQCNNCKGAAISFLIAFISFIHDFKGRGGAGGSFVGIQPSPVHSSWRRVAFRRWTPCSMSEWIPYTQEGVIKWKVIGHLLQQSNTSLPMVTQTRSPWYCK